MNLLTTCSHPFHEADFTGAELLFVVAPVLPTNLVTCALLLTRDIFDKVCACPPFPATASEILPLLWLCAATHLVLSEPSNHIARPWGPMSSPVPGKMKGVPSLVW
jgi:hypothetical protein